MSRRVENRKLHVAQSELITFLDWAAVLKVELVAVVDLRPGASGEFDGPDHVILVAVRFEDVCDLRSFTLGDPKVLIDVATRVDHGRLAAVAKNVRQMSHARRVNCFHEHHFNSSKLEKTEVFL